MSICWLKIKNHYPNSTKFSGDVTKHIYWISFHVVVTLFGSNESQTLSEKPRRIRKKVTEYKINVIIDANLMSSLFF